LDREFCQPSTFQPGKPRMDSFSQPSCFKMFQEWGTSMAQPPFVRRLPNLPSSTNSPGRTALKGPCSRIGCTTARETWLAPSFWVFQAFQSCLSCLSVQSFFCFLRDHPHYVLTLADLTDCKNLWKKRHISRPLRTLTCSKPRKCAQRLQQEPFKGRTWWYSNKHNHMISIGQCILASLQISSQGWFHFFASILQHWF